MIRAQIILVPMEYGLIDDMSYNNFEMTLLFLTSTGTDFFIIKKMININTEAHLLYSLSYVSNQITKIKTKSNHQTANLISYQSCNRLIVICFDFPRSTKTKTFYPSNNILSKKKLIINNTHPCYIHFSSYPLCDHKY